MTEQQAFDKWWIFGGGAALNNPFNIWKAACAWQRERPDCSTCANRGQVDGLSQETHCDHCIYGARYRTNHYAPNA